MDFDLDEIEILEITDAPVNRFETEMRRKKLNEDMEEFFKNGGKIDHRPPQIFIPHYKKVGFFKEGVKGQLSGHGVGEKSGS